MISSQRLCSLTALLVTAAFFVSSASAQVRVQPVKDLGVLAGKTPVFDGVNLIFLGEKQPVLIRINVRIGDRPVHAFWNSYIERWFRYLDVNNDGGLDNDELKLAPNAQAMRQLMFQGAFFPGRGGNLTMGMLNKQVADKVTLAELQAYYAGVVPPIQVGPQVNNNAYFGEASNALFKALDLDKDGKLSKAELLAAPKTLHKLDLDDDEWITIQELSPNMFVNNAFIGRQGGFNPNGPISDAFFHIRPGENRYPALLLARYDRDMVQKVNRKGIGLDAEAFAKLDKNKDGGLDVEELAAWHDRPADLEFTVSVGKNGKAELHKPVKAFAAAVKETAPSVFQMSIEDAQINLIGATPANQFVNARFNQAQFYVNLLRQADVKKNGFVTMKDIQGAQFQFLRQVFPFLDRDRDGKLTEKEVQTFVNLQGGAVDCFVTLSVGDHGRALFQLIDVNRDGRLSPRELRNAWNRLAPLDKQNKGFIEPADLARQFQINVQRGQANVGFAQPVIVNGFNPNVPQPRQGFGKDVPEWFRKMDKNGDGDVSFAEFLGTRADFDRIDTDHDGLISADEAIRFDAQTRKKK